MQSSTIPNDQTQSTKSSSHCKIRDLTKVTDSRANNYKNVYLSGVQFILLVSFSKYTCQSHCIYRFQDMWKEKKRCSVKEKRPITNHTALWTLNFLKTQLVRGNSKKEALLFFNPSGLSPTCILLKESTSSATWQQLNLRQNSADLQAKQHFHMYYGEHHSNTMSVPNMMPRSYLLCHGKKHTAWSIFTASHHFAITLSTIKIRTKSIPRYSLLPDPHLLRF